MILGGIEVLQNTRKYCNKEMKILNNSQLPFACSKITTETLEQGVKYGAFIVNLKHISQLVLVFLSLTLNMQLPAGLTFHH